jgi:glycosyltransferase involved in cell wall biosynthesis
MLSVIIPNRNGGATIEKCLAAVFASSHNNYEVIVIDDCSTDDSVEKIEKYPCRLYRLPRHGGASQARNTGARHSRGDILFFLDADCLPTPEALRLAEESARRHGESVIIGGTYTSVAADNKFFSTFQSVYINYCESKRPQDPDYIATHAMVIHAATFRQTGGFLEHFMPILEDVEFSHRLRREGFRLVMEPALLVRHIFNFTLRRSLANAVRKSRYWTCYSLENHDLFADSGTASRELKVTVTSLATILLLALFGILLQTTAVLPLMLLVMILNGFFQRHLLVAFLQAGGMIFALKAALYYNFLYPIAVAVGSIAGIYTFFSKKS